ncbi:MAG: cellulase family glycosylhydrolase [Candidatus Obscuribacterales bacterium]|nr:cellulase family glycosylhydrolase [Steroidobacteraceae bacterium]
MSLARIALHFSVVLLLAGCGGGGKDAPAPPPPLPAGSVGFSASSYSGAQSTGLITVTVSRLDGSRDVTVGYATADGTATAGTHYTARTGTLTWASGDTAAKTISLPISNATANTSEVAFTITLSNPTNGLTLGTPVTAAINITTTAPATHSVRVSGNRLLDGAGNVLQLRGVNFSGFEFVAIGGWSPTDPSGGQAGQPNGPRWTAVKAWRANTVRFALNEASWLGSSCVDTDGVTRDADPGDNYRSHIQTQVQEATAAGLYVIIELHWAAPGNTCPMVQTQMANADHSIDFWTSVANTFRSNPAVIFSLYNEPFLFGLAAGQDQWAVMMRGGSLSYYPATSGTHNYQNITTTWTVASMQAMLDAVRATTATNVVLIGGVDFSNNMSGWLTNMPRDALNQIAAGWHPYPPMQFTTSATIAAGGSGYVVGDTITLAKPNTVYTPAVLRVTAVGASGAVSAVSITNSGVYLQTALPTTAVAQASTSGTGAGATFTLGGWGNLSSTWSMPVNWPVVQAISARVPVVISEIGEHNAPGTVGAPFLQQFLPFAGANNWSVIGCCWDVFQEQDNVLIQDVNGTPTDGYGRVFYDWMTGAAWQ